MDLEAQALGSCQEGVPGSEDGAVNVPVQLQLLQGLPRCEQYEGHHLLQDVVPHGLSTPATW